MDTQSLSNFLTEAAGAFEQVGGFSNEAAALSAIARAVKQPFNLAVVGRVKAGKSTLINGMIGRSLAISDVKEATATLNWICYGSLAQTSQFVVEWKDGGSEPFPIGDLAKWTGKSPDVLERVRATRFLRLYANSRVLEEIQIVDTPGTGSAVEEHETTREFLRPDVIAESIEAGGKADAIIYVFQPVGREDDKKTLDAFSQNRLPNSVPYNSVAVLHKWDHLEPAGDARSRSPRSKAAAMANQLQDQLGELVAKTIPVSGPLALAAREAPDHFFDSLVALARDQPSDTETALRTEDRWDRDETRKQARQLYQIPWPSFKICVRMALDEPITDGSALRSRCLEESGIKDLESFLRDRFFSQQAIIKQCQLLSRAAGVLEPALRKIGDLSRRARDNSIVAERAGELLKGVDPNASTWCAEQAADAAQKADQLQSLAVGFDRKWQALRSDLERLQMDLRVSDELEKRPDLFAKKDHPLLRAACNHLATIHGRKTLGQSRILTLQEIETLIYNYRTAENLASPRDRPMLAHIGLRLQEIHAVMQN